MTVLRDVSELLTIAKELSSWVKGDKKESLRLDCMHNLGVYTSTINVNSQFAKWVNKVGSHTKEFSADQVYDIKVYALQPDQTRLDSAVSREQNRLTLDLTRALDRDMIRLEIHYFMDPEWLKGLVHHRSSPEPLRNATKYHLSAQLTDPSSLELGFSEVEVEDYPVSARVHIQEDIDTALPVLPLIRRIRKIEAEMLSDYDPRHGIKIMALQRERSSLHNKISRLDPSETLRELLLLLRPTKFVSYLSPSDEDFRLHDCRWGSELLEMPGSMSMPKAIEVCSRTDLSLNSPTAKGSLTYDSGRFSTDVEAINMRLHGKKKSSS